MAPSITLDTSSATLGPPKMRRRDRDTSSSSFTLDDNCPVCVRARTRSAPDMHLAAPLRTLYTGERLAAVNRALATAALDHVLGEPHGLGSPSVDDEGKEVARFRMLQRHVRSSSLGADAASSSSGASAAASIVSTPRSRVGSMSTSLSSRPSSEHYSRDGGSSSSSFLAKWRGGGGGGGGETLEFRARFTLVKGARPGDWRYRVTDDWSNAEAFVRATPKLRHVVADAVTRLFARRGILGEPDKKDGGLGVRRIVGDGNDGDDDDESEGATSWRLESSRQLPGPPRGARLFG